MTTKSTPYATATQEAAAARLLDLGKNPVKFMTFIYTTSMAVTMTKILVLDKAAVLLAHLEDEYGHRLAASYLPGTRSFREQILDQLPGIDLSLYRFNGEFSAQGKLLDSPGDRKRKISRLNFRGKDGLTLLMFEGQDMASDWGMLSRGERTSAMMNATINVGGVMVETPEMLLHRINDSNLNPAFSAIDKVAFVKYGHRDEAVDYTRLSSLKDEE